MAKRSTKKKRKAGASAPVAAEAPQPIAIVLIDDNRLLREGLVAMLHSQPDFVVLAAAADTDEAIEKVRAAKPDIVLIDFGLIDHDSLGLTATVRTEVPDAKLIVMGMLASQEDIADYVRAGASGFVMKYATRDEFFETIRVVARGGEALPRELTPTLFDQILNGEINPPEPALIESVYLTARENEIVALIGQGLSNKELASRLNIAVHTVKSHVHNVLEKLALRSRLEVAVFAHSGKGTSEGTKGSGD